MLKNKKFSIVIIFLIWGSILTYMIMSKHIIEFTGTTVYLKVEPVDPRDLFRGDYVVLNYGNISRPDNIKSISHDTVYANLSVDSNNIASLDSFSYNPKSKIFLQGDVGYRDIKYGIESFFVPVQTGRQIEKQIQSTDMYAEVIIGKSGKAFVKNLYAIDEIR